MKKSLITIVATITGFAVHGQVLVDDINPGAGDAYPSQVTEVGNKVYFSADDGTNGNEVWVYDGTTTTLIDVNPGANGSYPNHFKALGNDCISLQMMELLDKNSINMMETALHSLISILDLEVVLSQTW